MRANGLERAAPLRQGAEATGSGSWRARCGRFGWGQSPDVAREAGRSKAGDTTRDNVERRADCLSATELSGEIPDLGIYHLASTSKSTSLQPCNSSPTARSRPCELVG